MNLIKLSSLLFLIIFYLLPVPFACALDQTAAAAQDGIVQSKSENVTGSNQQEPELNLREVENYINRVDTDIKSAVPGLSFKDMFFKIIRGDVSWKPASVFNDLLKYLFKEVVANTSLLGKLIVLSMICAVLHNLTSAFDRGTTGQLSYLVVYLVLATIAIGSFALAINTGRDLVDRMVSFMQAIMPLLLTLLVAMGGVASAAILHPVILISLTVIGTLTKNVVLPLIFFSAVLGIADNLSASFKVSRLAGLLKTVAMGLLGIFSTIFLGILAVQGVAGAVGDGVTLRTAKFAIDAFVPVVGGMFSGALESVVSSSLLIKNAAGITGMISIFLIMGLPMLKIISLSFIYKLAGALVQPVAEGQVVDCLNEMGSSLILVFAAVGVVGLLFFFSITILIGVGNMTVMLR